MKTVTQEELDEILKLHVMWIDGEEGGKCIDLQYACSVHKVVDAEGVEIKHFIYIDLEITKRDMLYVLAVSIPKIPLLKRAVIDGQIDGCLCGAISELGNPSYPLIYTYDPNRPIEIFFRAIQIGDTPENNQFSKIALEWIEEFELTTNWVTALKKDQDDSEDPEKGEYDSGCHF